MRQADMEEDIAERITGYNTSVSMEKSTNTGGQADERTDGWIDGCVKCQQWIILS